MRRGMLAAMMFAAFVAAGTPVVEAQVRIQPQRMQIQRMPRVNKPPQIPLLVIKPSQALSIAGQIRPGAKTIGIKQNGNNYVVTLRQNNQVSRIIINGQTGAPN